MTLTFGTAGVRAPLGPGPDELNDRTVALAGEASAASMIAAPIRSLTELAGL